MPNKAELVKLTDLSRRGKVSLNEAEDYLAKKGWKTKERNEALKYIDIAKKEHARKTKSTKKSGKGVYIIIFIILLIALLYYLSKSGIMSLPDFINFK